MNDTNLNQIIISTLQEGTVFVKEQAPLVVQEFLNWELIKYSSLAAVLGLFAIVAFILARMFFKWKAQKSYNESDMMVTGAIMLFLGTIFFIFSIVNIAKAVKVKVAPRVCLMEFVNKTARGR